MPKSENKSENPDKKSELKTKLVNEQINAQRQRNNYPDRMFQESKDEVAKSNWDKLAEDSYKLIDDELAGYEPWGGSYRR